MNILTISNLYVDFPTDDDLVRAVNGVDLSSLKTKFWGSSENPVVAKAFLGFLS